MVAEKSFKISESLKDQDKLVGIRPYEPRLKINFFEPFTLLPLLVLLAIFLRSTFLLAKKVGMSTEFKNSFRRARRRRRYLGVESPEHVIPRLGIEKQEQVVPTDYVEDIETNPTIVPFQNLNTALSSSEPENSESSDDFLDDEVTNPGPKSGVS